MTGRTLVLPPPSPVYLLGGTTVDLINVSALAAGVIVITTAQFIAREHRALSIPTRFSADTRWMADGAARRAWSAWRSSLNADLPWGGIPGYLAWPSTAAVGTAVRSTEAAVAVQPSSALSSAEESISSSAAAAQHTQRRIQLRQAIQNRHPFEYSAAQKSRRLLNLPDDKTANLSYRYLGQVRLWRARTMLGGHRECIRCSHVFVRMCVLRMFVRGVCVCVCVCVAV